tara:strand:- start:594 stop:983 length:390 start_codon:yes stop_codon:yes gene_type:complete
MNSEIFNLFVQGVKAFNSRKYYSAHEYFEDIWTNHHLDDRLFVQALIQLSVAYFHITNFNKNGAIGLFNKSISKLDSYKNRTEIVTNINDVIELAHQSLAHIKSIESMDKFKWELAPNLDLNEKLIDRV